jgi:hypothetical protein
VENHRDKKIRVDFSLKGEVFFVVIGAIVIVIALSEFDSFILEYYFLYHTNKI